MLSVSLLSSSDFVTVSLSLRYGDVTITARDFTFYDCTAVKQLSGSMPWVTTPSLHTLESRPTSACSFFIPPSTLHLTVLCLYFHFFSHALLLLIEFSNPATRPVTLQPVNLSHPYILVYILYIMYAHERLQALDSFTLSINLSLHNLSHGSFNLAFTVNTIPHWLALFRLERWKMSGIMSFPYFHPELPSGDSPGDKKNAVSLSPCKGEASTSKVN